MTEEVKRKLVDASGLSCPEPTLRVRNALDTMQPGEELEVLVETVTSRENVRRLALSRKHIVKSVEALEDGFRLIIQKT